MELGRFVKIMRLAESDQDGEALAALRKATSMLKEAGLNWEEFIVQTQSGGVSWGSSSTQEEAARTTQAAADAWARQRERESAVRTRPRASHSRAHRRPEVPIEAMLLACAEALPENRFIQSLARWFHANGSLTVRQEASLKRVYDKLH